MASVFVVGVKGSGAFVTEFSNVRVTRLAVSLVLVDSLIGALCLCAGEYSVKMRNIFVEISNFFLTCEK